MIERLPGAATRGFLVALMIALPALMVPGLQGDGTQIVVLIALLAGVLTLVEYNSNFPSIIEFRDAGPFNRLRFAALFLSVFLLSALVAHDISATGLTSGVTALGTLLGGLLDFPYSPVRLTVIMLPPDASAQTVALIRAAAGICLTISLILIATFGICVRFLGWPTRRGPFNVWVNLPLFDPTAGRDVVYRLQRDARVNIAIGFLLPFFIPAWVKIFSVMVNPIALSDPQTLIWTLSAWAFLPTSMIMRGIAMAKVASLITTKRKRAYQNAMEEEGLQTA